MKSTSQLYFKAVDVMTGDPTSIDVDAKASRARQLMIQKRIDHLPVKSEKKLRGVLTSSHLVFNTFQATMSIERSTVISEEQRKLEFPIKYIMDTRPLTCDPKDSISPCFG